MAISFSSPAASPLSYPRRGRYVKLAYQADDITAIKAKTTIRIVSPTGKVAKTLSLGWKKTNAPARRRCARRSSYAYVPRPR